MNVRDLLQFNNDLGRFWNKFEWPHPTIDITHFREIRKRIFQELNYMEVLCAAAVKFGDGRIFIGTRHDECFKAIVKCDGAEVISKRLEYGYTAGFVTNMCRFLDKKQAYKFALANGQIKPDKYCDEEVGLTSEDLW